MKELKEILHTIIDRIQDGTPFSNEEAITDLRAKVDGLKTDKPAAKK